MISSIISEKGERFMDEVYNATLIRDTLLFLLPAASSPNAHEREMTLARMTRLIDCIPSHAVGKVSGLLHPRGACPASALAER
ncbi:UNVERIFIED_CONTAM: hypothetical protein K2H54_064265 [Gekko kuhli]